MVVNSIMQNEIRCASVELGKQSHKMLTQRISERAERLRLKNSRVMLPLRLSVECGNIKCARNVWVESAFQSLRHLRGDNQTNLVNNCSRIAAQPAARNIEGPLLGTRERKTMSLSELLENRLK